ncbi:MAG TPA: ABC transporter substrate-binding protein [Bradyrhizobium sp.]|jgi:putative ABC transport system substrate-binding protein|nr:ABC transporter substrate-binding protein [Bradyrhizobium sp.]
MRRRDFIKASSVLTVGWPRAAHAQPAQLRRVGALILGNADADAFAREMREGLAKSGYVEGRNVVFDIRSAQGRPDLLPQLAKELVAAKVDVLVALYTPCARAAQQATRDIPVVAIVANPVETGIIESLARPGGNITGVSLMAAEAHGKCVEVFSELLPSLRKVAALGNAGDSFMPLFLEKIHLSAGTAGVEIVERTVRGADEIEPAIARAINDGAGALVMQGSLPSRTVAELALKHRLPAGSFTRSFPEVGGLMSYGPDATDSVRRGVYFVIRILQGGKPAEIPAEQPTKFELVSNLGTAKALGISVPATLLARADDVIE